MNVHSFLEHWGLTDNPFRAEEAKDDPVFERMLKDGMPHPDFEKIFGSPSNPAAAVVFGEKGSGKTAMRIQMTRKLEEHNKANPDGKVWMISYDDLNPILDRFTARLNKLGKKEGQLGEFRLEDHMDAILSLGVTRLLDMILNREGDETLSARKLRRLIGRSSKQRRLDLAELALIYDQPAAWVWCAG
jgi:predicted transcriptional regulator